ncbi:MAG: DMT family transporter [Xanthobacteraceae bacterium]|nr:DMT family transporter [Xanthobacteraceae bacterium]
MPVNPERPRRAAALRAPQRTDRPFRGIALVVASTVFLACSDALAKYLTRTGLPVVEIAWIRFFVFVLIMMPAMMMRRGGNVLATRRPVIQVLRGVGLVGSSLFFIWGLSYLPIAEASATAFIAPMFVTCLSIVMLAEKVGVRRWIATFVGLIGVLIVVRPGTAAFHPAAVFPIVSALGWAFALVLTRQIAGVDRPVTTMAWSAIVGFVVLSLLAPFFWVTPSWQQVAIAVLIGIAATLGHWIVVLAYRHADASVLAPFTYSQLVWVSVLGVIMFAEIPDRWTVLGASIIICSGLYIAHRERIRKAQMRDTLERAPGA